jgi:hypothetical protein
MDLTTQILWSRLVATVEEQARTLMRTAFSPPCAKPATSPPACSTLRDAWSPRPSPARPATSIRWPSPPGTSSPPTRPRRCPRVITSSPTTPG